MRRASLVKPTALVRRAALVLVLALCCALAASAQTVGTPNEPLPLDVALSLRGHNGRSPINLSPDGRWIAHTVATDDTVPRGTSYAFAATGFPFAEGNSRMEATLDSTAGEETIRLGSADASSWAPVWSPDGTRVAFYSDQAVESGGGREAGLWVWHRESGEARPIGDHVVRPFFGFESVRWTPDGERLLVKLLPEGVTLEEANALLPAANADAPEVEPEPGEPTVTVRRSRAMTADEEADPADAPAPSDALARRIRGMAADLALVDVATGRAERIVHGVTTPKYELSPDGRHVAYTANSRYLADSQQALYDLRLLDLETAEDTLLAEDVPLRYGIEWSWSPDGTRLAYTRSGQVAEGEYVVVEAPGGPPTVLENDAPHFAPGEGEVPPLWSADGRTMYGVGDGALWEVDPASGAAREIARIDGWRIRNLLTSTHASPVAWSRDGDRTLWVVARRQDAPGYGIHGVDVETGETSLRLEEDRSWAGLFSLAASDATGEIFYVARGQRQPGEIFALDAATGAVRQATRINADLARYALGEARVIDWRSSRGEALAGALLLPPGWQPGDRPLPLVVWVYGGSYGSESVNRFGFRGSMPAFNLHVLATRGYAVLFPDAPLRTGRTVEDLAAAVLPGVDAAVEQGYADPERLAIMGQSFGALNVLALLTVTDRFDAAIITAAVQHPDLFADYLHDSNTGYYEQGQGDMGGTIWEVPERYRANSPLFDFPDIDTPVLIGQGDQDGDLVPSDAIFTALDRLGKVVEYRVYGGESHVISRAANVRDFWERRLEFLAEHLDLEVAADGTVSPSRE